MSRRLNICIQFKIIAFFIITLFAWLYARISIFLTRGNHLYDCIISLMGDIWAHKASLSPPRFIEVPVSSQENEGIMYLWDWYIDFASFLRFLYCSDSGVFLFFILLQACIHDRFIEHKIYFMAIIDIDLISES